MINTTKRSATVVSGVAEAIPFTATQNPEETTMTSFMTYLDRAALTLINVLVIAGLPLAAMGFAAGAL